MSKKKLSLITFITWSIATLIGGFILKMLFDGFVLPGKVLFLGFDVGESIRDLIWFALSGWLICQYAFWVKNRKKKEEDKKEKND